MNILAVDPGDMTGIAEWIGGRYIGRQLLWQEAMDYLVETINYHVFDLVVCEAYTVSAGTLRKSRETTPLEGIGVLRWTCTRAGIPFELSAPSSAMSFASNDVLKRADMYLKGAEHARDAARHLLLALAKLNLIDKRVLLPTDE